ncbi:hypothetical protein ABTO49_21200, partial [Acinetobacter baumannii]
MTLDLPIPYTTMMINSWSILGNFMYPKSALQKLVELVKGGLLPLDVIEPKVFTMPDLQNAMDAAAKAGNFENVMINCQS